jgi:hypothetical protein
MAVEESDFMYFEVIFTYRGEGNNDVYQSIYCAVRTSETLCIYIYIYCDMTPESRNSPLLDNGSLQN